MAVGMSCTCPERKKPVSERNWVCTEYKWNSGAFVSDGGEPSDYSTVICKSCGSSGRTKAAYVGALEMQNFCEAHNEWRASECR